MDPARGRGSAGGEAGRGVGRGEALAQLIAARRRPQLGPETESSASGVSVGRGQLLRQLATGSQTDGSSVASVGGGRGELLRRMAMQVGSSPSNSSEASSSVSGRPVTIPPAGRAGMVSVLSYISVNSEWHGQCVFSYITSKILALLNHEWHGECLFFHLM